MIDVMIKRDGSQEAYAAKKVNGWGEWAAKHLGDFVDWSGVVMKASSTLPEVCTTSDLQYGLIKECLNRNTWSYNLMAGRLYAAIQHKEVYPDGLPTILQVHGALQAKGYMVWLDYSEEDYAEIETYIRHKRDFTYAHMQHFQIRYKYALRNRLTGEELETTQFVFMRMAMALAEDQPAERRLMDVKKFYDHLSKNRINAPTPNYTNLGTQLNGYASCCLYAVADNADSLSVGDHIAYTMTVMSAGIGNTLNTRSLGDPVRGGLFAHRGKLPYLRSMQGAVQANIKNGRNGACTSFYSGYDPEVKTLMALKNPMTPIENQIRGMDYAMMSNKFFGRKGARQEDVFLFNSFTAPDLYESFYGPDPEVFEKLYAKYEADPTFKKTYVSAREVIITVRNEAYETGRSYLAFMDEINRHTPSKDPIRSSNLCVEIAEPTEPYNSMLDLYSTASVGFIRFKTTGGDTLRIDAPEPIFLKNTDKWIAAQSLKVGDQFTTDGLHYKEVVEILEVKREPEVALCSLAALVITNIHSDEEYADAAYYALLMIDKCIHKSDYKLPHVGYTAKNRMSAGLGMMDLAYHMAKKRLKYSSIEGKTEIHRVAERHSFFAISASLRLGKELGNAPWIHRTKWIDGWLPIDTANRSMDGVIDTALMYSWEPLRAAIKANRGIRNSFVVALMPGESSSKASGTANSVYPVRALSIMKSDNDMMTYWSAPDSDRLGPHYELAYDIPTRDMIDVYGILQMFVDQSISADLYARIQGDQKITTDTMLEDFFHMLRRGMKTQYYTNVKSAKAVVLDKPAEEPVVVPLDQWKHDDGPTQPHFGEAHWDGTDRRTQEIGGPMTLPELKPGQTVVYEEVENTAGMKAGCEGDVCSL